MSHTGILENVVTTLVGTKQQAYEEHAEDTREVMHISISNLFPQEGIRMHCKLEVQQRKLHSIYTDKERCATESCCRIETFCFYHIQ
jgi:hypothetical protein